MTVIRCFFAVFAMLLSLTAAAAPQDYVLERGYIEDASNAMSWEKVQQMKVTPYQGMLAKGYSRSSFWVKLKLQAAPDLVQTNQSLILRIEPTYLDEIALYDPLEPTKKNRFAGDRHEWADFEYQSLVYNFMLPASTTDRDVWLRLKTSSTSMMSVHAYTLEDEHKRDQQYLLLTAMLSVLIFIFFVWGALYWSLSRDRLIGIFTIKQFVGLAFVASYAGYFRLFLSDHVSALTLDYMNNGWVLLTTFTTVWFHFEFFKDYALKRWGVLFFYGLLSATPLALLLIAFGDLTGALKLNMIAIMLASPFMLTAALTLIDWSSVRHNPAALPKRVMIGFHGLFLVVASITAIPTLGIIPITDMAPHFVMIHGFLTGLVMLVMLQWRNKRIYENQVLATKLANQQAEQERQQRSEERRFLEMLTHELRTSLSVIQMAIGTGIMDTKYKAHAENAIRDVSQVMERCLDVQEAEDGKVILHKEPVDFAGLLAGLQSQFSERAKIKVQISGQCDVQADIKLLKVLLNNLVDNAVKYGEAGQPIQITVACNGDVCSVEVLNKPGHVGMPDPSKVFEKYYRAERAHGIVGSGLGLYLMKNIARLMGGDLRYLETNGQVCFVLFMPA